MPTNHCRYLILSTASFRLPPASLSLVNAIIHDLSDNCLLFFCRKDMVCMNEEDRKLQIAMSAHMKQLIGQLLCVIINLLLLTN